MIYMPDAHRMVLTVEADPFGGFVVTSSTHSLLHVHGETLGEALAAVPPKLAAAAVAQERIDAATDPIYAHALAAEERRDRFGLRMAAGIVLLLSAALWALIIMALRS